MEPNKSGLALTVPYEQNYSLNSQNFDEKVCFGYKRTLAQSFVNITEVCYLKKWLWLCHR
jgi:hypothetical protein